MHKLVCTWNTWNKNFVMSIQIDEIESNQCISRWSRLWLRVLKCFDYHKKRNSSYLSCKKRILFSLQIIYNRWLGVDLNQKKILQQVDACASVFQTEKTHSRFSSYAFIWIRLFFSEIMMRLLNFMTQYGAKIIFYQQVNVRIVDIVIAKNPIIILVDKSSMCGRSNPLWIFIDQ